MANIALAVNAPLKQLASLLGQVIDQSDEFVAIRVIMGRMYELLRKYPERAREFSRFLEYFWIQQEYDVPEDMSFIAGIEDEFQLAEQGVYGTVEEATRSLLDNLAQYKSNTEPCA